MLLYNSPWTRTYTYIARLMRSSRFYVTFTYSGTVLLIPSLGTSTFLRTITLPSVRLLLPRFRYNVTSGLFVWQACRLLCLLVVSRHLSAFFF